MASFKWVVFGRRRAGAGQTSQPAHGAYNVGASPGFGLFPRSLVCACNNFTNLYALPAICIV